MAVKECWILAPFHFKCEYLRCGYFSDSSQFALSEWGVAFSVDSFAVLLSLFKRAAAHNWQIWECLRLNLTLLFPKAQQKCNLKNLFSQFLLSGLLGFGLFLGNQGEE